LTLERLCDSWLVTTNLIYADSPVDEIIKHLPGVKTFGAPRRK